MWIDAENGSVYTPRMEGGMPRVNIYDISRHAGVSIATVSRVLNNSPHVSEETRRKVMKVIDGCGYVPNAFARGLGLNTMKTIGLLCPDAADPYLARALACLEHAFRQKHYDCLLSCTNRDLAARRQGVELLTSRHVDGMVLMGSTFIEEKSEENDYIRQAATNVPVVLLNGSFQCPNVFCVLCDDERAMKYAQAVGRRVPEDLSVVGYNNSNLCLCTEPELTSVDNRLPAICERIVETMLGVLEGREMPEKTVFTAEIIQRGSTRAAQDK